VAARASADGTMRIAAAMAAAANATTLRANGFTPRRARFGRCLSVVSRDRSPEPQVSQPRLPRRLRVEAHELPHSGEGGGSSAGGDGRVRALLDTRASPRKSRASAFTRKQKWRRQERSKLLARPGLK